MVLTMEHTFLGVVHEIGRHGATGDLIAEHLDCIGREVLDIDTIGLHNHMDVVAVNGASVVPELEATTTTELSIGGDVIDPIEREVGRCDIDIAKVIDERSSMQRLVEITKLGRANKQRVDGEMMTTRKAIELE